MFTTLFILLVLNNNYLYYIYGFIMKKSVNNRPLFVRNAECYEINSGFFKNVFKSLVVIPYKMLYLILLLKSFISLEIQNATIFDLSHIKLGEKIFNFHK